MGCVKITEMLDFWGQNRPGMVNSHRTLIGATEQSFSVLENLVLWAEDKTLD